MYKFLTKHGQTAAFGLGLLVVLVFFGGVFSGLDSQAHYLVPDGLKDANINDVTLFDNGLYLTIVLLVVALLLAFVVFLIWNIIKFPKESLKFLALIGILVLIFLIIFYSVSVNDVGHLADVENQFGVTENISRFISAAMWTSLGLAVIAFASMFLGELRNAFK